MLKVLLLISFFLCQVVLSGQANRSRSMETVKDSILKLKHKDLIKFTFNYGGSLEYAFIFGEKKEWAGLFIFDNSNRSRRTDQSDDIRVKKFKADAILKKLDSLGLYCLESTTEQKLSETYNSQMHKSKNPNVIYDLPTCPGGTLITIEVRSVSMSMVNCWYELSELKTIPEVNRFSKIAPYIIKEVHKLY